MYYNKILNMKGGGYFKQLNQLSPPAQQEKTYYIMAELNPESSITRTLQRNKDRLLANNPNGKNLHLTMLTIHINLQAPAEVLEIIHPRGVDGQSRLHQDIVDILNPAYDVVFRNPMNPIKLRTVKGYYQIMGQFMSKQCFIKGNDITDYRMQIYRVITRLFTKKGYNLNIDKTSNAEYVIVSAVKGASQPVPIYAIPKYDFGTGVWSPHISLAQIAGDTKNTDIKSLNPPLYGKIEAHIKDAHSNPAKYGFDGNNELSRIPLTTSDGTQYKVYKDSGIELYKLADLQDPDEKIALIDMNIDISHVRI
jgi:hypothetical protein